MSFTNLSAVRGHAQALKFVEQAGSSLSKVLSAIADAKDAERRGPLSVFLFLAENFEDDETGVHSIPVPGSKKGETGNDPFDKYTTTVKTQDGEKKVPGSWYTDVVKNSEEGKRIEELLPLVDGGDGAPEVYQNMGFGERKMEKQRLRDRIRDMRTALVKGAMLYLHAYKINQLNPDRIKVKMPFKQGKIFANTIRLVDPAEEIETKVFTVSEFLRIDLSKLTGKDEDQTITSLENTKSRAPKTKDKKGQQSIAVPTNVETLLTLGNVFSTAIDENTAEGEKLKAKLLAKLSAPGKEGDDAVETLGDFAMVIDDLWTTFSDRYHKIKKAKATATNQKQVANG
jgi:hypothetical protein